MAPAVVLRAVAPDSDNPRNARMRVQSPTFAAYPPVTSTPSISTLAPFGSEATPIAARAG